MSVRIVFLGGLGEIGRNCFCLEVDGRILVVDCGVRFPAADRPGIDLVLPDFTYLRDNADRVEAVLLTHAHEDHAGGLAFLLRDISVPIYGSALSLALARNRIDEAGMLERTELIAVADGERRRIGPIECQFVPVTHSVPHGFAVAFVGRSMLQNVSMARERGFIDLPEYAVLDIEETTKYAPGEICIICTGSQGEPMSALSLMAAHEHKYVKVSPDDVVVISAHAIPGNESNVPRRLDAMHRAGAEVVHDRSSPVHVSGHASKEELKFMLNLL